MTATRDVGEVLSQLFAWLLAGGVLVALGAVVWECLVWLKQGAWSPLSLASLVGADGLRLRDAEDWRGLARLAAWILELRLWWSAPIVAVGAAIVVFVVMVIVPDRRRDLPPHATPTVEDERAARNP